MGKIGRNYQGNNTRKLPRANGSQESSDFKTVLVITAWPLSCQSTLFFYLLILELDLGGVSFASCQGAELCWGEGGALQEERLPCQVRSCQLAPECQWANSMWRASGKPLQQVCNTFAGSFHPAWQAPSGMQQQLACVCHSVRTCRRPGRACRHQWGAS